MSGWGGQERDWERGVKGKGVIVGRVQGLYLGGGDMAEAPVRTPSAPGRTGSACGAGLK